MERKKWLEWRRQGLGGADAASIVGLSPWKTEIDIWMEKKNLALPDDADPERNFMLDLGLELEPVVARLYERQTGRVLVPVEPIVHPTHPELRGSPDRLVRDEQRGVELKTENQFSEQFGEPGTDEVPSHYLIQAAHYMMLTNVPFWDIAVLHAGTRFTVYTIKRDFDLEEMMLDKLVRWWDTHMVRDIPPEIDASNACRAYLHQRYPRNILPIEELAPNSAWMVDALGSVRKAEKALAAYRQEYENNLKAIIGDREGVYCKYGRVTWKNTKDGEYVDWEKAFNLLGGMTKASDAMQLMCLKKSSEIKPGVRRFLYTPAKERDRDYAERNLETNTDLSSLIGKIQGGNRESLAETSDPGEDRQDSADHLSQDSKTGAS